VLLALRPEHLVITGKDAPGSRPGEVVEVSFFGHDAMVRVRVSGTESVAEVLARVPATEVPLLGAEVGVRVVAEVLAFPREPR
jgi:iron(III) transport system ATP-binding protein